MSRRPFIAGNWKITRGPAAAGKHAAALAAGLTNTADVTVDVAVAPVAVSIPAVAEAIRNSGIHLAGQNLHAQPSGAFTGEHSAEMLREAGCAYVIIGHSERRQYFGETDESVQQKVLAAFRGGLLPILCIGETLDEREAEKAEDVVGRQLRIGLEGLKPDQVAAVTIAYEPVWAIGTGKTATPEMAQQMHAFIRAQLAAQYPPFVSEQVRIQYGGSVKPHNAAALLAQPDIDGALVGGASLKADSFLQIIAAVTQEG